MKKFIPDETLVNQSGAGLKKRDDNVIATMLLTLARAGAYLESGEIKDVNGVVVPESNIVKLIGYVCRPESSLPGLEEVVTVLRRHGIDSLPNENISQIIRIQRRRPPPRSTSPSPVPSPSPPPRSRSESPIPPPPSPLTPSPHAPDQQPSSRRRREPDGRHVPLPPDEDVQNTMQWTSKRKGSNWLSLDEPIGKRTRASAGKRKK